MAAKIQPKKGKPAPKKNASKAAPKKAAAAKKSAPLKKAKPPAAKKSAAPKKAKPPAAKKVAPPKKTKAAAAEKSTLPKKAKPAKAKTSAAKTIPLADFVNMTYLTENGVKEWLKQGRLTGLQDESGQWMIEAANLEVPGVKRLIR
ncbi:MAG: hypothetical protein V2I56_10990 [Desulfobacteraceae bacterium]|nr:hypothetical protein [Desulfobacteraceae bacterium]